MLSITNSLVSCSKNKDTRALTSYVLLAVDAIVGAIILSIGIAALCGQLHLPQTASIAMIAAGSSELSPALVFGAFLFTLLIRGSNKKQQLQEAASNKESPKN